MVQVMVDLHANVMRTLVFPLHCGGETAAWTTFDLGRLRDCSRWTCEIASVHAVTLGMSGQARGLTTFVEPILRALGLGEPGEWRSDAPSLEAIWDVLAFFVRFVPDGRTTVAHDGTLVRVSRMPFRCTWPALAGSGPVRAAAGASGGRRQLGV